MASKPTQPALYEKMRNRMPRSTAVEPKIEPVFEPGAGETLPKWLGPGKAVRLPIGYILLACSLAVIVVMGVYVVGVRQGRSMERVGIDQQIIDSTPRGIHDPLADLQPVIEAGGPGTPGTHGGQLGTAPSPGRGTPQAAWGPVVPKVDPRRKGLNYYVLMETTEPGAIELAEFCRSRGLESYVLSGKNSRLRRVIAFPGFDLSVTSRTSREVQAQHQRILQVGELWAKSGPGRQNLSGTYLHLYGG